MLDEKNTGTGVDATVFKSDASELVAGRGTGVDAVGSSRATVFEESITSFDAKFSAGAACGDEDDSLTVDEDSALVYESVADEV